MRGIKRLALPFLAAALLLTVGCTGESVAKGEAQIIASGGLGRSTTYRLEVMEPGDLSRTANLTVAQSWQLLKTVSTGASQIKNDVFLQRYLIPNHHEAIISDDLFQAVQTEKLRRNPETENAFTHNMSL